MKKIIHDLQLEARVVGRNWLNSVINENHPKWLEALKPFVGKVIYKADGKLRAEVRAVLPTEVRDVDQCVHLGYVERGVLKELAEPIQLKDDYDVADVRLMRNRMTEREVSELEGELRHFGRYDS